MRWKENSHYTRYGDVGINVDENGNLCGDAERSIECFAKTPVPGGIGPMTITALLWNCV